MTVAPAIETRHAGWCGCRVWLPVDRARAGLLPVLPHPVHVKIPGFLKAERRFTRYPVIVVHILKNFRGDIYPAICNTIQFISRTPGHDRFFIKGGGAT